MKTWLPVLGVALILAGCGSSSSTQSPAAAPATITHTQAIPTSTGAEKASTPSSHSTTGRVTRPAPKPKPVHACLGGGSYGGIGASASAFKRQNPTAANPPPPSYQDGIAIYEIKAAKDGCVSEYTITEATTPTQSSRDLLSLVAGIGLPNDAQVLSNQSSCEIWSSASLERATGKRYAVGYVEVPPEGDATGIVDMSASSSSQC